MENGDDRRYMFPLTSFQIGDLQSYHSDLSLFLGPESKKLYILVDNRPWLRRLGSRSAHLWQLMVTKSRLSPFANTKVRREKEQEKKASSVDDKDSSRSKNVGRWLSLVKAATLSHKRVLLPVKKLRNASFLCDELRRTLYGFIVFEITWSNVRGINYLNELQTDTSLAIEAKFMLRWEFDSINLAASSISSWFSGTHAEQFQLKEYFKSSIGDVFQDATDNFSRAIPTSSDDHESISSNSLLAGNYVDHCEDACFSSTHPGFREEGEASPHTPPPTGPYKRRRITRPTTLGGDVDFYSEEIQNKMECLSDNSETGSSDYEYTVEPSQYRDVLILFRLNDLEFPFMLRKIIMSDLRLLTLLEAGLPSWAIFLQSYPGFCNLYRPWMCPLARALYVLISIVTVLIGFYDLYKNVPVLKATASGLFGPLFDWIETWEMVSRIKYLGTMLFLHNCQKAIKCVLAITRAFRSFFSILTQPLAEPLIEFLAFLFPLWSMIAEVFASLSSMMSVVIGSSCSLVGDLVEIILWPIWFTLSIGLNIVTSILYPAFCILWEVLYAPIRLILAIVGVMSSVIASLYEVIEDFWLSLSSVFQFASTSKATITKHEVSMLRSLWNDLFSHVFRATRSILNGLVAFFTACNRHRLSIYNHLQELIERLFGGIHGSQPCSTRHTTSAHENQTMSETRRKVHIS